MKVPLLDLQPQYAAIRADGLCAGCFSFFPSFQTFGSVSRPFPVADRAAVEVLALPVFPGLTVSQQAHVVTSIADALR